MDEKETNLVVRKRSLLKGALLAPSCRRGTPQAHHPLAETITLPGRGRTAVPPPLPCASAALTPIQGSGNLNAPHAAAGLPVRFSSGALALSV